MTTILGVLLTIIGLIIWIYNFTNLYPEQGVDRTWEKIVFFFLELGAYSGLSALGGCLVLLGIILILYSNL
jgi:hypothetical protein